MCKKKLQDISTIRVYATMELIYISMYMYMYMGMYMGMYICMYVYR